MGSTGNIVYHSIPGTRDVCPYNCSKQGAAELPYRPAQYPTGPTCACCTDCARFIYSVSNYSRIRTHSSVGIGNGSYRWEPRRLYYAQGSTTAKYTPYANSGRVDGV